MPRATNQIALTWSIKDKLLKTNANLQAPGAGRTLSVSIHTLYNYAIAQRRGGGLPIQSAEPEGALHQHAAPGTSSFQATTRLIPSMASRPVPG